VDVRGTLGQFRDSLLELDIRNAACNNEVGVTVARRLNSSSNTSIPL